MYLLVIMCIVLATMLCAISTVNSLPLGAETHQFDSNTPQTLNLGLVRGLFFFEGKEFIMQLCPECFNKLMIQIKSL